MKRLPTYINEKLILKQKQKITPSNKQELDAVIFDHFKKHNGDLNDIDVSKLKKEDFYRLFFNLTYEIKENNIIEIDISEWKLEELYYDEYHDIGVFEECNALKTIILPDCLKIIGVGSFYGCFKLNNITIPDSVQSIGNKAFHNCNGLESIRIPDLVEEIGEQAFWDCANLKSVIISDSVQSIGRFAFDECPDLKITVPNEDIKKMVEKSGFKGEIIIK